MRVAVIIPAAGVGRRFFQASEAARDPLGGGPQSKIDLMLGGQPVFLRTAALFRNRPEVVQMILAVHPETLADFQQRWGDQLGFHGVTLVAGGTKERWETVLRALEAVTADATHVAVHDAVRPLASQAMINRVFAAAGEHAAVIPGVPVSNTLKRVAPADSAPSEQLESDPLDAILGGAGKAASAGPTVREVVGQVDRANLMQIQTPQVFEASLLRRAYAQITDGAVDAEAARVTDDAGLIELLGEPVQVVDGDVFNIKITQPDDLKLAEALLAAIEGGQGEKRAKREALFDDDDDL